MAYEMSELQISLLVIGVAVVLVLYGLNWRQQRQYRRKFGAAFKAQHEDALYRQAAEKPLAEAHASELLDEELDQADPTDSTPISAISHGSPLRTHVADEICPLLDAATDYILMISLNRPTTSDALARLWQQRFDFGQDVHVCGLNASSGAWEKVLAESRLSYSAFKLALQLVNRSGAISEARLADFRDLVRLIATQLQADVTLSDVAQTAARAQQLDKFCAAVDQIIGLNIFLSGARELSGREVAQAAEQHGLSLQADGAFHLLDEHGHTLFSLGNADNTPFQHHALESLWIDGLTLLLDVPRVERPAQRFDQMAVLARQLAADLHAVVADDRRVALSEAGIKLIREQITAVEAAMLGEGVVPGSTQARRLFS